MPPPQVQEQRQTVSLRDRVEMNCQVSGIKQITFFFIGTKFGFVVKLFV